MKLKLYKLEIKDFGYDEYDAFVVLAYSKKDAKKVVVEQQKYFNQDIDSFSVKELSLKKRKLLLSSFSAG